MEEVVERSNLKLAYQRVVENKGAPGALVDRLIQQALHQVLQPLVEPTFSHGSYGFRPGDRVNHDVLMARGGTASQRCTSAEADPTVPGSRDDE